MAHIGLPGLRSYLLHLYLYPHLYLYLHLRVLGTSEIFKSMSLPPSISTLKEPFKGNLGLS